MTTVELPRGPAHSPALGWEAALAMALADPAQPRLVFQPIVDLARARVAGYECLARFSAPFAAPPDEWFRQAYLHGCAEQLEARVVAKALEARARVPQPRFLTVNITPSLLPSAEVQEALRRGGDLTGLVVELTEHVQYDLRDGLPEALAALRAAGVLIAMDDAGSGYAGLAQLLDVRPHLVKLDRSLVADIDVDAAKASTARLFGGITGSLDAWLLAEGIERIGELETCIALGIPLAQGYLLGRPGGEFAELPDELARWILLATHRGSDRTVVASVLREGVALHAGEHPGTGDGVRVRVDDLGCPTDLLIPLRRSCDPQSHRRAEVMLMVNASTPLPEAARRATARPEEFRLDPLVCVDDSGLLLGVVAIEDLINALADVAEGTATKETPA